MLGEWRYHAVAPRIPASCLHLILDNLLTTSSQSAVVRGAALRGLEGIAPRKKHARRHYGVGSGQLFREGIDPEENSFVSQFDEKKYCDHRTNWMIGKASCQKTFEGVPANQEGPLSGG